MVERVQIISIHQSFELLRELLRGYSYRLTLCSLFHRLYNNPKLALKLGSIIKLYKLFKRKHNEKTKQRN